MAKMDFYTAAKGGRYYVLKGKTFEYKVVPSGMGGEYCEILRRSLPLGKSGKSKGKRRRATALVVESRGHVLLVREKGSSVFSLPGGGMRRGEKPEEAAAREVREEVGLQVGNTRRLFEYSSPVQRHQVVGARAAGKPKPDKKEVDKAIWWDRKSPIRVRYSAREIIGQAELAGF